MQVRFRNGAASPRCDYDFLSIGPGERQQVANHLDSLLLLSLHNPAAVSARYFCTGGVARGPDEGDGTRRCWPARTARPSARGSARAPGAVEAGAQSITTSRRGARNAPAICFRSSSVAVPSVYTAATMFGRTCPADGKLVQAFVFQKDVG